MALQDILANSKAKQKKEKREVSREDIEKYLDKYQELIGFWRMYPDKFVDYMCGLNPHNKFHLYTYQRVYLRAALRHQYTYFVFPRGAGKSFLAALAKMIQCILYPGIKVFSAADNKEQSSSILQANVGNVLRMIPAFEREIIWDTRKDKRGSTKKTRDLVVYSFKNGSSLQNVAMTEATRGQRFNSGILEEIITMDPDILNEVIIPTMTVSRQIDGRVDPQDRSNQSQVYITTAGYKNSFAYAKLIEILCKAVINPDNAFIMGGDWRLPVIEGLQPKTFLRDQKMSGTLNEAGFGREYESVWAGAAEGAFFEPVMFDKYRVNRLAENTVNGRNNAKTYYVLGVDVGRHGCTTEVIVLKISPIPTGGAPLKQVVNIFTFDEEHFGMQAIKIKKLYMQYKCKIAVVDSNGLGTGLVDFLVSDQRDADGTILPNLGVYNDEEGKYKPFINEYTIPRAMYLMKATSGINTECYSYVQTQMNAGKMRFLIDEAEAKNELMSQTQGKNMTAAQRADYLQPYVQTSILRDQMMNLVYKETSSGNMNIVLVQQTRNIKKDKFSALMYGMYWAKLEEDKGVKRKARDLTHMMLLN